MRGEIPWYLPAALGFSSAVLVWALLCAAARRRKGGGR